MAPTGAANAATAASGATSAIAKSDETSEIELATDAAGTVRFSRLSTLNVVRDLLNMARPSFGRGLTPGSGVWIDCRVTITVSETVA